MAVRKHRDYGNNKFPSVTTVIGQLSSFGLMEYFKRTSYADIMRESKRAKEIGTDLHSAIQNYIETGNAEVSTEYPDEVRVALSSFCLFRKENGFIKLRRAEKALTSLTYKFNGTIDCISDDMVVDWKSSKCGDKDKPQIYEEAKIQTAAYCYLINDVEGLSIEKALIVSIAKDKEAYNTFEMNKRMIDGYFNEVFLPLLKVMEFRKNEKEMLKLRKDV